MLHCNYVQKKNLSYDGVWVVKLFIYLMRSCNTCILERTWRVRVYVPCLVYILRCSCKICEI